MPAPDRLVPSPVFVLSSLRSGSTLLRVLLNSHSQVHAPHEMHLRTLGVQVPKALGSPAMAGLGLDQRALEHLLWDRILHLGLTRSGKRVVVDKTPGNAFVWERLAGCWPRAQFIFLLRHPGAVVASVRQARPELTQERAERQVLGYVTQVEAARTTLPGLTVRYEDLVQEPESEVRRLCSFLGVRWEPTMLDYGRFDHGPLRAGLGDWSDQIRSGRIQPAREAPEGGLLSPEIAALAQVWGYGERRARAGQG